MTTVWDQDRSVEQEGERGWNTTKVFAFSNTVMYKVQQSHGPQQSCRPSSLLRSEVSKGGLDRQGGLSKLGFCQPEKCCSNKRAARAGMEKEVAGIPLW